LSQKSIGKQVISTIRIILITFIALSTSLISNFGFADENVEGVIDSRIDDLATRMKWRLSDPNRAENFALLFTYFGPVAWSKPELRIQVGRAPNYDTEFIELTQHADFVASELYDHGIFDTVAALKKSAKYFLTANATTCPKIGEYVDSISIAVIGQLQKDFSQEKDRSVRLDGGASFNFYFGTAHNSSFSYTAYYHDKTPIEKLTEFKKYLVSCGSDSR
jgi:hypothetical protein